MTRTSTRRLAAGGTTVAALVLCLVLPASAEKASAENASAEKASAGRAGAGNPATSCRDTERFSRIPCLGRKPMPRGVGAFLAPPTRSEWQAQLDLGWGGSDGSTAAPDNIGGVRIGATSRAVEDADLPANRHDWYYELGRTYGLGGRFRKAADDAFLAMCLERIRHVRGLRGFAARADLLGRYAILRTWGFAPWRARPGPVTAAPDTGRLAASGS